MFLNSHKNLKVFNTSPIKSNLMQTLKLMTFVFFITTCLFGMASNGKTISDSPVQLRKFQILEFYDVNSQYYFNEFDFLVLVSKNKESNQVGSKIRRFIYGYKYDVKTSSYKPKKLAELSMIVTEKSLRTRFGMSSFNILEGQLSNGDHIYTDQYHEDNIIRIDLKNPLVSRRADDKTHTVHLKVSLRSLDQIVAIPLNNTSAPLAMWLKELSWLKRQNIPNEIDSFMMVTYSEKLRTKKPQIINPSFKLYIKHGDQFFPTLNSLGNYTLHTYWDVKNGTLGYSGKDAYDHPWGSSFTLPSDFENSGWALDSKGNKIYIITKFVDIYGTCGDSLEK